MAHIIPDEPRSGDKPEFPPKRSWITLQPKVPDYDDPGFDAARRAWLAWWELGKAMGFAKDTP